MNQLLTRRNFWIIATNSTASFVLAYLFIFYLNQFTLLLSAGMYDYAITIDYGSYFFHVEPYQWTHDAVITIFSAGYILTLIVGLIALLAFYQLISDAMPVKIFFFWLAMHAITYFFGGLMVGNLLTEGIGHVFNWMYLTDTAKMVVSLIGFFGLLMMALFAPRLMAISADSYFEKFNERMAPFFIMAQVIVPFILGSVLVYVYFIPKGLFQEKYGWIVLGVMMILFFLRANQMENLTFEEDDTRSIRLMRGLVITSAAVYIVSRIVMQQGIYVAW